MTSNGTVRSKNSLTVRILGTADAFSSGGHAQAGYLVEWGKRRFLLEAGPGLLAELKKSGVAPAALDVVVISHLHGDHFGGLAFLILEYIYRSPRKRPLVIAGPPRIEQRTWALMRAMFPGIDQAAAERSVRFVVLAPGRAKIIQGARIRSIRNRHTARDVSLSLRFEFGRTSVVFSGDTGWNDELVPFSAGADLMLCECTYWESAHEQRHMNYPELRRKYDRFTVGRFTLVHLGFEVLNHASEIDLEMAREGMVVEL